VNKTMLVLRHELLTNVTRKSYLFVAFGIPLIVAAVVLGISLLGGDDGTPAPAPGVAVPDHPDLRVEGYFDQAGIIQVQSPAVPEGVLVEYASQEALEPALESGEIAAYYLVPDNYLRDGQVIYVNPDYRFVNYRGQSWVMESTLTINLLGNDAEELDHFWNAMRVQERPLAQAAQDMGNSEQLFGIPYATTMVFYFVIIMAASMLMSSVSEEKKNRVIEIMLLSVSPRQLLAGKILGLGIAGLIQVVAWVGTLYAVVNVGGVALNLPAGFSFPPNMLPWALVFFLLGYAVYASLMAGVGALAPNIKESSQAVILVLWPLILPLFLIAIMIEQPHAPLATILSLIPFTAPTVMMMRLSLGGVPFWQPLLAAALLAGTAVLVVRAVARLFRAQTLLAGQPLTPRRFYEALVRGH
jgi:ABC-2 type transport system permease protein